MHPGYPTKQESIAVAGVADVVADVMADIWHGMAIGHPLIRAHGLAAGVARPMPLYCLRIGTALVWPQREIFLL
jgi:hypothetical protein